MNLYKNVEEIGEGAYGIVFKAFDNKKEKFVAIKTIKFEEKEREEDVENEIHILRELRENPNIVTFINFHKVKNTFLLTFDLYDTDLYSFIRSCEGEIETSHLKKLLFQILSGVKFFHSKGVIHRDLKPKNIMIDFEGNAKIGDFGISVSESNKYFDIYNLFGKSTHQIQTLLYRAPELLLGEVKYSNAIDIWSVGCIFGEMILLDVLFEGDSEIGQLYKIFQVLGVPNESEWPKVVLLPFYKPYIFPNWKKNIEKVFPVKDGKIELLEKFFIYDPEKRISAEEALECKFFE